MRISAAAPQKQSSEIRVCGNFMKAYILISGTLFGLIVVAHIARVVSESLSVAKDPWFILSTAISAGMCYWSWRLLRRRDPS